MDFAVKNHTEIHENSSSVHVHGNYSGRNISLNIHASSLLDLNHNTGIIKNETDNVNDFLSIQGYELEYEGFEGFNFLFRNGTFGNETFSMFFPNHSNTDMFQTTLDYLNLYFTPVIILFGLVGNLLSFLVFTLTHLKRLSSSLYLSSLALADIFFLLALLVVWIERFKVPLFATDGWCEVVEYVNDVCGFLAMWMVLSFTAERYIVTYHPLKKDKLCNRRKATIVVISLTIFAMALYSHTFWTHGVIKVEILPGYYFTKCVPMVDHYDIKTVMESIDTILACIIPSFVIVILNIKIIIKIHKYQAKRCQSLHNIANQKLTFTYARNRSGMHTSISTTGSMHIRFLPKSQENPMQLVDMMSANSKLVMNRVKYEQVIKGSTQYRTARMLLVLSSVFVLLTIPNRVFKVQSFIIEGLTTSIDSMSMTKSKSSRKLTESFQLLYFLNFAINFFIYSACGRQFRTGLKRLCKRWRQNLVKCHRVLRYAAPVITDTHKRKAHFRT